MKTLITIVFLMILIKSFGQVPYARTEITWVANDNGKKIKKEQEKQFDSKGNLVKWIQYLEHTIICENFKYEYAQSRIAKETRSYCNGIVTTMTVYTYDKLGRIAKEVDYDKNNKVESKRVNTYKGVSKSIAFTEDFEGKETVASTKTTYEYYPNNLLKTEVEYANGSWFQTINYKYDGNKNKIYEGAEADGGVGLVQYYYTYKNNILIKDSVTVPGSPLEFHVYETIMTH